MFFLPPAPTSHSHSENKARATCRKFQQALLNYRNVQNNQSEFSLSERWKYHTALRFEEKGGTEFIKYTVSWHMTMHSER